MKKGNSQPIIHSLILILGLVIGLNLSNSSSKKEKINTILDLVQDNYVDTLNSRDFEDRTISAILKELDPHSSYMPAKNFQRTNETMKGSFSGIGVEFNIISDSIVVVAPISGGPSEELGIQSGDRIVTIEKEDVASIGIKNEGVIERLRGKKGTKVSIQIKRKGENELLDFTITRDNIPLNSVDVSLMLEQSIGYIKVNRFSATTSEEFYNSSKNLLENGMKKLILDLRENPGGYLNAATEMCDHFLERNLLIVYTEGRKRSRQEEFSTNSGLLKNIEVVVLINEGSASASEIVSGCLQDNDRGLIIGSRSFGKGLVQEETRLADGSAVRITTQRYYTPSGRCIQKPYGKNNTEYYLEQYTRSDDEIVDTLKFFTRMGRVVYGGGGITPDILIPREKDMDYSKVNYLVRKGWVSDFSIKYSEKLQRNNKNLKNNNREKEHFIHTFSSFSIYEDFKKFILEKESDFDFNIGEKESEYLITRIKASVGKNIWGNESFFMILNQQDPFIIKAKNELN